MLLVLLLVLLSLPAFPQDRSEPDTLDRALQAVALTRSDLTMRTDLTSHPPGFEIFLRWMQNPLDAPSQAQIWAEELLGRSQDLTSWWAVLAQGGDLPLLKPLSLVPCPEVSLPAGSPETLSRAIRLLLNAIHTANQSLTRLRESISPQILRTIQDVLYPDSLAQAVARGQRQEGVSLKETTEALRAAQTVDRKILMDASLTLLAAVKGAMELLRSPEMNEHQVTSFSFMTEIGLVVVGGKGPDVHEREAALIIDLGGNDLYRGKVASGRDGRCALVIDLEGDDLYVGEDLTQGSGVWGIGILLDIQGDDLYKADHGSQGFGLFGVGLLVDQAGNDRYLGGELVQAAASWGCGALVDLAGEDLYECRSTGQSYSGVLGLSCLCDLTGSDRYISGSNTPDPREPDMNQSFSQGFSMGMRNQAPGGISMLIDGSGNDLYQCQYFGQGSSYWMGVGLIYDREGNDTYIARRYAQGAGIHYSLGMLLDVGGHDHTVSWAVSQGCGHDYGIGILLNEDGNDSYVSDWLSTGASEANGIGIFVDAGGDDAYQTKSGIGVGRLTESRHAGGVGIFVDAGGKDRYAGKGADDTIWTEHRWGVGIDENEGCLGRLRLSLKSLSSLKDDRVRKKRLQEREQLTRTREVSLPLPYPRDVEGLLEIASHWGLEEVLPREAQETLLLMDPQRSVPAMVGLLRTPNILSLMFLEKFFTVHAFAALPLLMEKTKDPDTVVQARALHMLAQLKDTRAVRRAVAELRSPEWKIRAGAARAVGEMLNRDRLDDLLPLEDALSRASDGVNIGPLREYIKEDSITPIISALSRSTPLEYTIYQKYGRALPPEEIGAVSEDLIRIILPHLKDLLRALRRWIKDIQTSQEFAPFVMEALEDPDPAVRKAAVFALGQMRHHPALQRIPRLLGDPDRWVRDATVLSLALFRDSALPFVQEAMKTADTPLLILGLDVLSRIRTDTSRTLLRGYLDHMEADVRRAAAQALFP